MTDAVPHLRLLQGFELLWGGQAVRLPHSAQRVLAFLALQDRPVRRLYVAGSLWLDVPEASANASLRTVLWRLRRTNVKLVHAHDGLLSLGPSVHVDARQVTLLAKRLIRGDLAMDPSDDLDPFGAGDLLPDWYEDWILMERERFRQLRLHALEALCEQLIAAGRFAEAAEAGLTAAASEPLRESAHRAIIKVHLAEGNRTEAVRQLELYRRVLGAAGGLTPSASLERLARCGIADGNSTSD